MSYQIFPTALLYNAKFIHCKGAPFKEFPCEHENGGIEDVSLQLVNFFFSPELHGSNWAIHLPFSFAKCLKVDWGVLPCWSYQQKRYDELMKNNSCTSHFEQYFSLCT